MLVQVVGEEVMVLPKTEIKEEDVVTQVGKKIYKITGYTLIFQPKGRLFKRKLESHSVEIQT